MNKVFSSESWNSLSEELRSTLQTKKCDGEFWMQYEDFIKAFDLLEFCHITHWRSYMTDGSWVRGISNGGVPTSISKTKTLMTNKCLKVRCPLSSISEILLFSLVNVRLFSKIT